MPPGFQPSNSGYSTSTPTRHLSGIAFAWPDIIRVGLFNATVKRNSIGALIMHLAAAEAYYQVATFENREFNEEERKSGKWHWSSVTKPGKNLWDMMWGTNLEIYHQLRQKPWRNCKREMMSGFLKLQRVGRVLLCMVSCYGTSVKPPGAIFC